MEGRVINSEPQLSIQHLVHIEVTLPAGCSQRMTGWGRPTFMRSVTPLMVTLAWGLPLHCSLILSTPSLFFTRVNPALWSVSSPSFFQLPPHFPSWAFQYISCMSDPVLLSASQSTWTKTTSNSHWYSPFQSWGWYSFFKPWQRFWHMILSMLKIIKCY